MTQKITYPVKVKLKADFNKKLDSIELDLKDKLILNPKLDVLDGKVLQQIVNELNESIEKSQLGFMQKLSKEYEKAVSSVSDAEMIPPRITQFWNGVVGMPPAVAAGGKVTSLLGTKIGDFVPSTGSKVADKAVAEVVPDMTVAEAVAAKLGISATVVTAAMTAGVSILVLVATTHLMNEFSKPEKRQEIKQALVNSYNNKIRPQLEDWAKEQIDLCNE